MPHAWLITGVQGIGKATLAFRFARWILNQDLEKEEAKLFTDNSTKKKSFMDVSKQTTTFLQVASGAHPNLLSIERNVDEKNKRLRSEIVVNDVRRLIRFFGSTAVNNGWRVVIIDAADDMNRSSANAMLKFLEEPPNRGLVLLISHSPGRLLQTVRSRCRQLKLYPLSENQSKDAILAIKPRLENADIGLLNQLSNNRPGYALKLDEIQGIKLYTKLISLIERMPRIDESSLDELTEHLNDNNSLNESYKIIFDLLSDWISRGIATEVTGRQKGILPSERTIAKRMFSSPKKILGWLEMWEQAKEIIDLGSTLNLNQKQVLAVVFGLLAETTTTN